jgi:lysozyme
MIRPVPQIACDFVAQHEACRLTAYADVGGISTIGFGHTLDVRPGMTCSSVQAAAWLEEDLGIAAKRLAGVVDEAVILRLTDHQYAALLSFVFNCGAPRSATLFKVLNAQQFERVPGELMKWVYAGGKLTPGLVNRRDAEVALWATPDAQPAIAAPPLQVAAAPPASANSGWLSRLWNRFA